MAAAGAAEPAWGAETVAERRRILHEIAKLLQRIGADRVPQCGTNDEVLRAHGLDAEAITARIAAELPARVL